MNKFKSKFSIKDLENLSGIKAHTIRIWEKRYNLLHPHRTHTNIRYYNLESLQLLLNVGFLNENGYKISKIAKLPKAKIEQSVKKIAATNISVHNHILNLFKLAMLNFDQHLFYDTFENLSKEKTFPEIFHQVFVPLLSEIGVLWQTDTITPVHEHFISTLIRQKIVANTEKNQSRHRASSDVTYVLFLPDNEIHELGLMYIHFEIISKGYHSILLGPSVPMSSLNDILTHYENVTFLSYFTIYPEKENLLSYLKEFEKVLLKKKSTQFWILGKMLQHIETKSLPEQIKSFHSIDSLTEAL